MINNQPDKWSSPFNRWYIELKADNPEFFAFMTTKKITVVDKSKTYHLVATPEGRRFIESSKLANAEALGLSVRRM